MITDIIGNQFNTKAWRFRILREKEAYSIAALMIASKSS